MKSRQKSDIAAVEPLTKRETQIALEVSKGLSNREIAVELEIGPETVKCHVQSILKKLGLNNRTKLAIWFVAGDQR